MSETLIPQVVENFESGPTSAPVLSYRQYYRPIAWVQRIGLNRNWISESNESDIPLPCERERQILLEPFIREVEKRGLQHELRKRIWG